MIAGVGGTVMAEATGRDTVVMGPVMATVVMGPVMDTVVMGPVMDTVVMGPVTDMVRRDMAPLDPHPLLLRSPNNPARRENPSLIFQGRESKIAVFTPAVIYPSGISRPVHPRGRSAYPTLRI